MQTDQDTTYYRIFNHFDHEVEFLVEPTGNARLMPAGAEFQVELTDEGKGDKKLRPVEIFFEPGRIIFSCYACRIKVRHAGEALLDE